MATTASIATTPAAADKPLRLPRAPSEFIAFYSPVVTPACGWATRRASIQREFMCKTRRKTIGTVWRPDGLANLDSNLLHIGNNAHRFHALVDGVCGRRCLGCRGVQLRRVARFTPERAAASRVELRCARTCGGVSQCLEVSVDRVQVPSVQRQPHQAHKERHGDRHEYRDSLRQAAMPH